MKRKTLARDCLFRYWTHKGENIDMKLIPGSDGIIFRRVDLKMEKMK